MEAELKESIITWAATRSDEIVMQPKNGFYSFDIVMDAYRDGKERGKSDFINEIRSEFVSNLKQATTALIGFIVESAGRGYAYSRVFVKHGGRSTFFILTVDEELHNTDNFIDFAYSEAAKLKTSLQESGLDIDVSFVDEDEHSDFELIKSDGFDFSYDLTHNKSI